MKLSEELQELWSQFMDVYAANTAGRVFKPAEMRAIIGRLAAAAISAEELEKELSALKPAPQPEEAHSNVVAIANWQPSNKQKRSN